MKNVIKISILSALVAGIFSACSSEPKSVQYYEDPKNAEELAEKIKECKKNANSELNDDECANAYKAEYSKSFETSKNMRVTEEEKALFLRKSINE